MKKVLAVLGVASTIALAAAPPAHADPSADSALALGVFAIFNQFVTGQTALPRAYPQQPVYAEPAPPVYHAPPTPAAYYRNRPVQDGRQLSRSHRYELYNTENASYGIVSVDSVPGYVQQGAWIYDRTARVWVSHPSVSNHSPQYAAYGRNLPAQGGLRLPRSHQYELYNTENASYGIVSVDDVPSYVAQGAWIHDRTAGVWVSHPSVGNPNPQYGASGRRFRR